MAEAVNEFGLVVVEDRVVVSSRDVANVFEKEHAKVLRDIRNLECSKEFAASNFGLGSYKDSQNQERPEYLMTRDGFTFLAMGFTGAKAAEWKERYIVAFNQMEAELREARTVPAIKAPASMLEALEAALEAERQRVALAERNEVLKDRLERTAPKAEAWDKVCDMSGTSCVADVAKAFGIGRTTLFRVLREEKVFFQGEKNSVPYQRYIDNGCFVVKQVPKTIHDKTELIPQGRVTGKGRELIRRILTERGILKVKQE